MVKLTDSEGPKRLALASSQPPVAVVRRRPHLAIPAARDFKSIGSNGCRTEFRERDMNDGNGYGARPFSQYLSDCNQPLPGTDAAGPEYSLITDGQAQSLSSADMLTGLDCCTAAAGASV